MVGQAPKSALPLHFLGEGLLCPRLGRALVSPLDSAGLHRHLGFQEQGDTGTLLCVQVRIPEDYLLVLDISLSLGGFLVGDLIPSGAEWASPRVDQPSLVVLQLSKSEYQEILNEIVSDLQIWSP